jgi:hypothetical protein
MSAKPDRTRGPAKPAPEGSRKRRLWLLLIPVAIVVIPPLVVMACNLGAPELPEIDADAKAIVHVQDMTMLGSLKVEGIRRLTKLIASGKPSKNPWTVVKVYWKHRRSASVYVQQTGQLMPIFDAEAWAILLVPIEGATDEYHAYHYLQDGYLAYLDGPEGVKVLEMPFTPDEFHAQLVGFKKPFGAVLGETPGSGPSQP